MIVRDISDHVRHEAELAHLASHDPLTGLPNRRAFHERLEQEVEHARRHGQPLSVVILDLDGFKAINDLHGHPTGDRILVGATSGTLLFLDAKATDRPVVLGKIELGGYLAASPAIVDGKIYVRTKDQLIALGAR